MAAPPQEVVERVTTGATPGAPNVALQPTEGQQGEIRARLDQEYVAAGGSSAYTNYLRSLPAYIDDVTADFGADLYDRMLLDPHIAADIAVLKASILETGLTFTPGKPDADDDGHDLSVEIAENATRMFDELSTPADDVLWSMCDAIATGNRVAELVYRYDTTYTGRTRLVLDSMKVKPRTATAFVVDAYYNLVGLLARIPGVGAPIQAGTLLTDPAHVPNFLPREKFAVWSYRPKDNDPRGTNLLRPAYNPWWLKQQVWGEYLKYLTQFAGPSLVGYTSQDAQATPPTDANGNVTGPAVTPEQALLLALEQFRNGTVLALPFGAKVEPIQVVRPGARDPFTTAIAVLNSEITKAILTQSLATEEGQHSTRAAAGVHKDILDTLVRQGKNSLIRMIRFDVLRNWVRWNYGEKAVQLTPHVTLGEVEREDFAATAAAVADLTRYGFLHPSQFTALDERMDLPPRDPDWEKMPSPIIQQVSPQRVQAEEGKGDTGQPQDPQAPPAPEARAA